jgi:hypothetical protein
MYITKVYDSIFGHWQLRSQSSALEAGPAFATAGRSARGPRSQESGPRGTHFLQVPSESQPRNDWEESKEIW